MAAHCAYRVNVSHPEGGGHFVEVDLDAIQFSVFYPPLEIASAAQLVTL